jgi:Thioesterase-like superfamily
VPDLWSDLLACLDVARVADEDADVAVFDGRNQQLEYHRLFGGQILGQFIQVARLTCPDKAVKSLHTVFTREGRSDEPVSYQATRHHQGRSFAALTATARWRCFRYPSRGTPAPRLQHRHAPLPWLGVGRLEGRVALEEILKRFPEWDVDIANASLSPTSTVRGWESMPAVLK